MMNTFSIPFPPHYLRWVTPKQLGRDPDSVTERVDGDGAIKAVVLDGAPALLHFSWDDKQVDCRVEADQPLHDGQLQAAQTIARRLFGLEHDPAGFEEAAAHHPDIARLIGSRRGLRIPLSADVFEGIAWAIIGQQINLPFAYKLRRRLTEHCGQPIGTSGMIAHPTPHAVARLNYDDLLPFQFSRRKAEYLIDIARLIDMGALSLDPETPAAELEKRLLAVRGLGPWSVNYIMMRAFGLPDCVPLGDTGLTSALQRFHALEKRPDAAETLRLMQPFAPYRSLATYHLWMSLGGNPA
jgi:3-methyladenine DNA glycosylase/8-oxoguanine DNA glycosylase